MTFALPLPNGRQQFVDRNGQPLVNGTVEFYQPGGLVPKDTWQNFDATILNDNPLTLDALGSAVIWGIGRYRQIVKDQDGNQIWDEETAVLTDRPYEAGFSVAGTFAASDELARWYFTQAVDFAAGFDGSFGGATPNPSASTAFLVKRNATDALGLITVSTLGATVITATASNLTFTPGDFMSWHVPGGGANGITRVAATFAGSVQP